MKIPPDFFKGKKILITGHTGFKGSWLAFTLKFFGGQIYGFSLSYPTSHSHSFFALNVNSFIQNIESQIGDVRSTDFETLIRDVDPDFIFHLAAQAIVYKSYQEPKNTITTNTLGVLNLLEILRVSGSKATVVIVTSDKCYKNFDKEVSYVETDELGGDDPYSASKAAAELIFKSYIQSFPTLCASGGIATARAGNVFGGGDWSENRLIPDCVREILSGNQIKLRMPNATRPWSFVNDIISGYIMLAVALSEKPHAFCGSWNFASGENLTVMQIAKFFTTEMGGAGVSLAEILEKPHESTLLQINPNKANLELGWRCRYSIQESLSIAASWYKLQSEGGDILEFSNKLVRDFYK